MKFHINFSLIAAFLMYDGCFVSSSEVVQGETRHRRAPGPIQPSHQPAAPEQFNYRPYSQAPDAIKQLLQFQQAREPLVHIAPQPVPQLAKTQQLPSQSQHEAQYQVNQYKPQVQYARQPQYRDPNQIYQQAQNQQQHQQSAAAYRPAQYNQPQVPGPQYAKSLPPLLQQQLFNSQNQHGQSSNYPIAGQHQ